jgi:hypothetical protein
MNQIILWVALTLFNEARSDGKDGINLVADTIWNRCKGKYAEVANVVLAPNQYACWNGINPAMADLPKRNNPKEEMLWGYCIGTATSIVYGDYIPETEATHYWLTGMELKAWQYDMDVKGQVGRHTWAVERKSK